LTLPPGALGPRPARLYRGRVRPIVEGDTPRRSAIEVRDQCVALCGLCSSGGSRPRAAGTVGWEGADDGARRLGRTDRHPGPGDWLPGGAWPAPAGRDPLGRL